MLLILLLLLTFFVSFLIQILVIRVFEKHPFCIDDASTNKPQRFHHVSTPRVGGLGIFFAFITGFLLSNLLTVAGNDFINRSTLILFLLPAFSAGLYEDIKSNIGPALRVIIMAVSPALVAIFLDSNLNPSINFTTNLSVTDIGFTKLPLWLGFPFTIFSVVGVINAINIIDGFNGLASGVSIIALISFAIVSFMIEDQLTLNLCIILISAIAGFLVWNFPKGKIFLGDGGAYLIGFLLAVISILLVKRNPQISPWYPVTVLAYPIFEVFFSIYRKRFKRHGSAFKPDRLHLHMLIYKRITRNNPKTSFQIWLFFLFFNVAAFLFRSNTFILICIFFSFSSIYVYLYRRRIKFKVSVLVHLDNRAKRSI